MLIVWCFYLLFHMRSCLLPIIKYYYMKHYIYDIHSWMHVTSNIIHKVDIYFLGIFYNFIIVVSHNRK